MGPRNAYRKDRGLASLSVILILLALGLGVTPVFAGGFAGVAKQKTDDLMKAIDGIDVGADKEKHTKDQPSDCPGSSNPKTARETPARITKGRWDSRCKKIAQCIASSFKGITRVGGPNERCISRGTYSTREKAYKSTDEKCNAHPKGAGTGSVSPHAFGKGLDSYVTELDKDNLPAERTTAWTADDAEFKAGNRVKDWAIEKRADLNISEVIWNKKRYSSTNDWKGEDYRGVDKHYNHVHLSCN